MQSVHDELISILKSRTPKKDNPVDMMTDLLQISKEGAYRRLRGQIQLTLDEAVILAKKLGVSIDNLIETNWGDNHAFHISPFALNLSLENYYQTLNEIKNTFDYLKTDPNACSYIAGKVLSPILYFKYKEFTKFAIFRWIYLVQSNTKYAVFSDAVIPYKLEQLYKPFIEATTQVPIVYILNDFMFMAIIKDLNYLFTIKLITREEIEVIKIQLLQIIDDVEEIAARGSYPNGTKVSIYITDTYFDISYNYAKGNGLEVSGIGAYGLNFVSCMDPRVNENLKRWIDSLIKYSTSISQSGESQRLNFFNKQRQQASQL